MIGFGFSSDRIMKSMTAKTKTNKPEYRLITMMPGAVLLPIGLFWYGWTAEKKLFWLGRYIVLLFLNNVFLVMSFLFTMGIC